MFSDVTSHLFSSCSLLLLCLPFQVIGKYKEMVCLITSYEEMAFKGWTESVEALTTENLDEPLLIREETGLLRGNFGKHLMATLIEVKHLLKDFKHRVVPENVNKLFLRYVKFRNSKNILDQTVTRLIEIYKSII